MRFRDREERERYMDSLERQMEYQRQEIQRTLDQIEGSGRRRTALEKLRSSLPSLPSRASVRDAGDREPASEPVHREEPFTREERSHEAAQPRSGGPWWRRLFRGSA